MPRRVTDPLRPHETEEVKGKVFFEKPELILINHNSGGDESTNTVTSAKDFLSELPSSVVRTKSCNFDSIARKPDCYPQFVEYGMSQKPTHPEILEHLAKMEVSGFGRGSIVARRWAYPWRFMYHHQWGIIHNVHYTPTNRSSYYPFTVKWFEVGQEEGAWAEDLITIHACLTDELLCDLAQEQGVDVSEALNMIEQRRKGAV